MGYVTVFEVTNDTFSWSNISLIFGPIFLVILLTISMRGKIFKPKSNNMPSVNMDRQTQKYIPLTYIVLFISCAAIATIMGVAYRMNNETEAQRILKEGKALIVEGPVENFGTSSQTPAGKALSRDTFTVSGVQFSYYEGANSPGYHEVSTHGGPINRNGIYVRIHYATIKDDTVSPTILMLEIKE